LAKAGAMEMPPIIEATTSTITIVPTIEGNFLARVFEVLIVTFRPWRDALSRA
jgi:hypothetical protein